MKYSVWATVAACALGVACVLLAVGRRDMQKRYDELQASSAAEAEELEREVSRLRANNEELMARPPEIETVEIEVEKLVEKEVYPESEYHDIVMSADERELLARILALEAGDQPDVGERAVIEVIFNRVQSPEWPNSIEGVIYQSGQFEAVHYLDHPYMVPGEREYDNIDFVLQRGRTVLAEEYVYFATYKANGRDFLQIQGHFFGR